MDVVSAVPALVHNRSVLSDLPVDADVVSIPSQAPGSANSSGQCMVHAIPLNANQPAVQALPVDENNPIVPVMPNSTDNPVISVIPNNTDPSVISAVPVDENNPVISVIPNNTDPSVISAVPVDQPAVQALPVDENNPIAPIMSNSTDNPVISVIPNNTDPSVISAVPVDSDQPAAHIVRIDSNHMVPMMPNSPGQPGIPAIAVDGSSPVISVVPSNDDQSIMSSIHSNPDHPIVVPTSHVHCIPSVSFPSSDAAHSPISVVPLNPEIAVVPGAESNSSGENASSPSGLGTLESNPIFASLYPNMVTPTSGFSVNSLSPISEDIISTTIANLQETSHNLSNQLQSMTGQFEDNSSDSIDVEKELGLPTVIPTAPPPAEDEDIQKLDFSEMSTSQCKFWLNQLMERASHLAQNLKVRTVMVLLVEFKSFRRSISTLYDLGKGHRMCELFQSLLCL